MISVKNLEKSFNTLNGTVDVLKGITYEIRAGEKIVIVGPSGSGKSTFLRCLNLLEMPTGGEVYFDGMRINDKKVDVNAVRRQMGMVFQHFNLFPHLTIRKNITLAPVLQKLQTQEEADVKAEQLLQRIGLPDKADAYPAQLSGGQKQRVAIVRALAMNPKMMLFDEPTSALDPEITNEVTSVILELVRRRVTMLIVTHDMRFARDAASRLIYMDEGRIVEQGDPQQLFDDPKTPRLKEFIRSYQALPAQ